MGHKFGNGRVSPLETRLSQLLASRRSRSKLRQLKASPPGTVDFSSNDFLSLATDQAFRQDLLDELQCKAWPTGSTGSRLLDGNSHLAEQLEREIATFHGAEAGLFTNSGFDANVSLFTCLPQPGDVVVYDELIHASVHDGMKQSRANQCLCFKHNDTADLREVLQQLSSERSERNVFVAVESVYSMEGDIAPLERIVETVEELFPAGNCYLIVDEAHATGIYGANGRGVVSQMGLENRIHIRLHTFGKALACNGAIILCSSIIKQYLLNYARPLIYTTFMSYMSLSAIKVAYDWLRAGKTVQLAQHLRYLIQYLFDQLQDLKQVTRKLPIGLLTMPNSCPNSPIFALLSTRPRDLASHCQAAGYLVRAVVSPTVPKGTERVRICLHAGNTEDQINHLISCIREWISRQIELSGDNAPSKAARIHKGRSSTVDSRRAVLLAKL